MNWKSISMLGLAFVAAGCAPDRELPTGPGDVSLYVSDLDDLTAGTSIHYQLEGAACATTTYPSVPAGAGIYTIPSPYGSCWTVSDEWGLGRIATAITTDDFDERVFDLGGGNLVWRFSNAVTSGGFSDLPNSPSSPAVAGETSAFLWNDRGLNHTTPVPVISTRAAPTTPYFHGSFRFKSATGAAQADLTLNISPTARQSDRRNSFISLSDVGGTGLNVGFFDSGIGGTFAPAATTIATGLSYTDWHKIDIYIEFVDGLNVDNSGNDIVTVLVNDVVVHVGTTWETFYRVATPTRPVGAVDALFFRASGTARPANAGNGFFFDDVVVDNAALAPPPPACTTTCYADVALGNDANGGASAANAKKTIQAAVTQVSAGGTVIVAPGTYVENVTIAKNLSLTSSSGRGVTTIDGLAGGSTIRVTGNTTALTIGGTGKGFTIMGKDSPTPGIEQAAVYFQGGHSGASVLDNNIVAGGEGGLITEYGAVITGFIISDNEFSGQTFVGPNPAGAGFTLQFTLHNVPRQLMVMGGGAGGGNTSNVTFTDNVVSGTAGGLNPAAAPQGNNLVTIDANGATISGNDFTGFTNRFAHSLRARGPNTTVTKNRFIAGSPVGVYIGTLAAATSSVTRNAIVGNLAGIFVEAAASPLAATCNWYGSATGPTNAANPAGTGDPVVGNLTFDPWLTSSNLDAACPPPDTEDPVVSNVTVTPNPAPFTTLSYSLTAYATDNVAVTSASYTINGGLPVDFTFAPGSPVSPSASLGPLAVGVYEICVTAEDAAANVSNTECTMLAVYDPNAGFVTGGGWINSPLGAYVPDPDLTGRATFGFVSKYVKGKALPTGNTQFQFKAGDLSFSSTSYEWLVVSGARAQFKGAGTINGAGDYRFMLTVIDGQINGGGGTDKFRIRIWNNVGGGLVYDNQLNAADSAIPTTVIGGGSIVIHVPKK